MTQSRAKIAVIVGSVGLLWAVVYLLVWGVAWFTFMRTTWNGALGPQRAMPWSEIWLVWIVLCVPLGVALAAYLRGARRETGRSKVLVAVVLALWVPMTLGMYGWAWFDAISFWLITIDSVVNLIAIGGASLLADATVGARGGIRGCALSPRA